MSYDLTFQFTTDEPWRARAERILHALQQHDPDLDICPDDDVIEAYTSEEVGLGLTFSFFEDDAGLAIPYWHDGAAALDSLQKIGAYLRIVSEVGVCEIYDPQCDAQVTAASGYMIDPASFGCGVTNVRNIDP